MTKPTRRQFLGLSAAAVALPFAPRFAHAQAYPTRTARIVVGFPAGGTADIGARIIGQWLAERLGQPFVIENKPGAGTHAATESVVRAAADGHTLLLATTANTVNTALYDKLSYDFAEDIAPVAGIMRTPFVLVVHPSIPVHSISDLIAYAKARPGQLNMASFGANTPSHLCGEMFKIMTGTDMQHVPYRGSAPMLIDLLGGQVQLAFDNLPASIEHVAAGKLRALAVTTPARSHALPDIPALGEILPGYEASGLLGIGAPRQTPAGVIDKLNREINAALADPKIAARIAGLSGSVLVGSPGDFNDVLVDATKRWDTVIRAANLKPL
jgi:tripartite-type tricarboxylate transporter receptor subunit TctC